MRLANHNRIECAEATVKQMRNCLQAMKEKEIVRIHARLAVKEVIENLVANGGQVVRVCVGGKRIST